MTKPKSTVFFFWLQVQILESTTFKKKKKLNGNLAGHNLWFTTRFWISMTKFFVIMNLPWQGKKFKESYQWINLGLVKFFTRDYANDHYLYEHFEDWIMLILFFYVVMILSVVCKIKLWAILKFLFSVLPKTWWNI